MGTIIITQCISVTGGGKKSARKLAMPGTRQAANNCGMPAPRHPSLNVDDSKRHPTNRKKKCTWICSSWLAASQHWKWGGGVRAASGTCGAWCCSCGCDHRSCTFFSATGTRKQVRHCSCNGCGYFRIWFARLSKNQKTSPMSTSKTFHHHTAPNPLAYEPARTCNETAGATRTPPTKKK